MLLCVHFSFGRPSGRGNCFYSSFSIHLCGNTNLVTELRILTCWELFHQAEYYAKHPIINHILQSYSDTFHSEAEIFSIFLSNKTFQDFDKNYPSRSVLQEAQNSMKDKVLSPLVCVSSCFYS